MNYRKHQNSKEVNRIVEERYLQDKFLIESKKEVVEKKPEIKKDPSVLLAIDKLNKKFGL